MQPEVVITLLLILICVVIIVKTPVLNIWSYVSTASDSQSPQFNNVFPIQQHVLL